MTTEQLVLEIAKSLGTDAKDVAFYLVVLQPLAVGLAVGFVITVAAVMIRWIARGLGQQQVRLDDIKRELIRHGVLRDWDSERDYASTIKNHLRRIQ